MLSTPKTADITTISLAHAEERYYLEHGKYTCEIDDLDIGFSVTPKETKYTAGKTGGEQFYYFDGFNRTLIDERLDKGRA